MSRRELHVLQATAWYPPYHLGGTEIYLEGLVSELSKLGIKSTVIVPRNSGVDETYTHATTPVETYAVNEEPAPNEMRDGKPHLGFDEFHRRLQRHARAIYHQHSWSRGCGPHHLRVARAVGMRTVLTVHVPANICLRGTMLKFGASACDGRVDEQVCGACWAEGRGLPRMMASQLARLPLNVGRHARRGGSRFAMALAGRALGAEKAAEVYEMFQNADRVVAVSQWLYEALAANGLSRAKLVLSRQGICTAYRDAARTVAPRDPEGADPLRLLYLGRWHSVKGLDVIVRAVRALPTDVNVRLTIHAVFPGTAEERAYEADVRALAADDPRIAFEPPVARADLADCMAKHDVLVVPSVWLETGPLVVLEAQAAGLFVLGSRLGGIAELVDEADAGELVEAGNSTAWTHSIERLSKLHTAGGVRRSTRLVRTMDAAAADMAAIYESL